MIHSIHILLPLVFVLVCNGCVGLKRCVHMLPRLQPWFQLISTCSLSSSEPLAKAYLQTVEECEQLAIQYKGLAFNFVSPDDLQHQDRRQATCIIYECQELDPFMLDDNSFYDYYGIYRDLDLDSNATCIPSVGMFHLHPEPSNFSEAVWSCEGEGAQLAHVVSAQRTDKLSALVAKLGPKTALYRAYIGMYDIVQEGFFVTVEDEPLNCFDYRSWAPGEPRSRQAAEDCVVLDSRRGWRTVDCKIKLPFLCELIEPTPDPCINIKRHKRNCLAQAQIERRKQRKTLQRCPYPNSNKDSDSEEISQ